MKHAHERVLSGFKGLSPHMLFLFSPWPLLFVADQLRPAFSAMGIIFEVSTKEITSNIAKVCLMDERGNDDISHREK